MYEEEYEIKEKVKKEKKDKTLPKTNNEIKKQKLSNPIVNKVVVQNERKIKKQSKIKDFFMNFKHNRNLSLTILGSIIIVLILILLIRFIIVLK